MAYTIKGLAKANEAQTLDAAGLADLWQYWLVCNCNDQQSVRDFMSLRKADRKEMLNYIRSFSSDLYDHLVSHLLD